MKALRALAVAAAVLAPLPLAAQTMDLSTIKCKEFLAGEKDSIGYILMWLEGYYSDEDAPPIVDFGKMKANGGKLGAYCAQNPENSIITAADEVMGK
jgi:acid stress chaperone HdeB